MVSPRRSNTIVYTNRWGDTVAFYRDSLGFGVAFANDWFVEFEVAPGAYLSVADAARATVAAGDGRGITLSFRVDDVAAARAELVGRDVEVSAVGERWGAAVVDLHDPAGNRVELWSSPD